MTFPFENTYARLPDRFFAHVKPTKVRDPRVIKVNRPLAARLGLDADLLASPEGAQILAGNTIPPGATPIALGYAGHQFGHFAGQLGDGRAILLGEIVGTDGQRRDLQLKGAGRTPYSRGGDGRAALGPVLREYLVSEAMAALGVPTTRALAAVTTGEPVQREELLPGGVLVRVAASHLRVGTFELLASRGDLDGLRALTSYALGRHYPDAVGLPDEPLALLERVIAAQAALVARWMGVGFIHGVMNTDNTSISGETIDYGPCAFLDEYTPNKTFSSIDRGGRYAFGNQPRIALWNLTRLAETLVPLLDPDQDKAVALATDCLGTFSALFTAAHDRVMRAKLGFTVADPDDAALLADLLERMAANEVDFTLFFRQLCASAASPAADADTAALFAAPGAFHDWAGRWRPRLRREPGSPEEKSAAMRAVNPAFIPRNHRIEEIIRAAVRQGNFSPFEEFSRVLEHPYEDQPEHASWREPPRREERVRATFCGT
jgi:uncharacterized protein YdiU (UPF0061 family)